MRFQTKDGRQFIDAVQVKMGNATEIQKFTGDKCGITVIESKMEVNIPTASGIMIANNGDYIVRIADGIYSVIGLGAMVKLFDKAPERKKAMLSQPMRGIPDDEIKKTRERAIAYLESQDYEVINTLFTDEWYSQDAMKQRGVKQVGVCFLAKSIENMSLCDAAFFCLGWEDARGCVIEHEVAEKYGLTIIHESDVIKGGN